MTFHLQDLDVSENKGFTQIYLHQLASPEGNMMINHWDQISGYPWLSYFQSHRSHITWHHGQVTWHLWMECAVETLGW